MKPTTRAVISALTRAPLNSVRERFRCKSFSNNNYLVCLAHPDDEILVAGFCSILKKYSLGSEMRVLTDGSGNTNKDRMMELGKAYKLMGYPDNPSYLISENFVYELAASDVGGVASDRNLEKLSGIVRAGISSIGQEIGKVGANRVVTNAFEGGHFVHDLTNFMVSRAAKNAGVEVYESSQYSLVPHIEASLGDVHRAINDSSVSVGEYATYNLGAPLVRSSGLEDEALGVSGGILKVDVSDFILKNRIRHFHKSQVGSLGRSAGNITKADFSYEYFWVVPMDRDFFELPGRALPLYELCDWRKSHLTFKTFRKLVEMVDSN